MAMPELTLLPRTHCICTYIQSNSSNKQTKNEGLTEQLLHNKQYRNHRRKGLRKEDKVITGTPNPRAVTYSRKGEH